MTSANRLRSTRLLQCRWAMNASHRPSMAFFNSRLITVAETNTPGVGLIRKADEGIGILISGIPVVVVRHIIAPGLRIRLTDNVKARIDDQRWNPDIRAIPYSLGLHS